MSTQKQIEANRLNSQKSTGPRSPEGRAAVRFNAFKTGIHAQSQVIPGEDPAELDALAAEYHLQYQPATPTVRALVDTLVTAEWMQRRFRTLEAQLFHFNLTRVMREEKGLQAAQAYDRDSDTFDRIQRRINAFERIFHRAFAVLQKIESAAPQPGECCDPSSPGPDPQEQRVPRPAPDGVPARWPGQASQAPAPDGVPARGPGQASQAPAPGGVPARWPSEASQTPPDQPPGPEIGFDPSSPSAPLDSVVVQPAAAREIDNGATRENSI